MIFSSESAAIDRKERKNSDSGSFFLSSEFFYVFPVMAVK